MLRDEKKHNWADLQCYVGTFYIIPDLKRLMILKFSKCLTLKFLYNLKIRLFT